MLKSWYIAFNKSKLKYFPWMQADLQGSHVSNSLPSHYAPPKNERINPPYQLRGETKELNERLT